jgi:hypothetical protein
VAMLSLTNDWRIASDELCWRLERRRTQRDRKTGEQVATWRPVTYHGTLGQAASEYAQRGLRLSNAEGIAELRAEHESLVATLSQAFAGCFEPELIDRLNAHGRKLREASCGGR